MVEFALIFPLVLLLLLMAVDLGRVFFGWVALTNSVRIAANEAAFHPEAWKGSGNAYLKDIYRQQVIDDLTSINCEAPGGGSWTKSDIPDPTFVDVAGTPTTDPYELGDHAQVILHCDFHFLTPIVGAILGDPQSITATSVFPVKGGEVAGVPVGNAPPTPPACNGAYVPDMVGTSVAAARNAWTLAGFTGAFSPSTGNDLQTVTSQTTSPVSSPGQCLAKTATVNVTSEATCAAPALIGLTANNAKAPYVNAGFTGTFTINRPPNNNYNVGSQSLVGGQVYVCSSPMTVFK
jgi:TadE-like protein